MQGVGVLQTKDEYHFSGHESYFALSEIRYNVCPEAKVHSYKKLSLESALFIYKLFLLQLISPAYDQSAA